MNFQEKTKTGSLKLVGIFLEKLLYTLFDFSVKLSKEV